MSKKAQSQVKLEQMSTELRYAVKAMDRLNMEDLVEFLKIVSAEVRVVKKRIKNRRFNEMEELAKKIHISSFHCRSCSGCGVKFFGSKDVLPNGRSNCGEICASCGGTGYAGYVKGNKTELPADFRKRPYPGLDFVYWTRRVYELWDDCSVPATYPASASVPYADFLAGEIPVKNEKLRDE